MHKIIRSQLNTENGSQILNYWLGLLDASKYVLNTSGDGKGYRGGWWRKGFRGRDKLGSVQPYSTCHVTGLHGCRGCFPTMPTVRHVTEVKPQKGAGVCQPAPQLTHSPTTQNYTIDYSPRLGTKMYPPFSQCSGT